MRKEFFFKFTPRLPIKEPSEFISCISRGFIPACMEKSLFQNRLTEVPNADGKERDVYEFFDNVYHI